jgi:glycolate oxidase FAD binding subunit
MQVEVRDSDAILGLRPRLAFAPASVEECAATMQYAARKQLQIGFIGGGTALDLGPPPNGLDAVVRTERLTRIVEHVPSDMVVVVEAGVTLAALQAALAAHGQQLALDPPWPERATVGGLVATGAFGPRRARYGAIRDLIIGVTLVLADGTVARGGGKVVKNVAGFDLPKLACGSLGTLAMIATVSFRLHPLPEKRATVLVPGVRGDDVYSVMLAARAAQLEPTSAVALSSPETGRFDLGVHFEGFGLGVDQQVARMVKIGRSTAAASEPLSDDAAAAFWRRHDAVRAASPVRVRASCLPMQFQHIVEHLTGIGDVAWYAMLGMGFASGALGDPEATAAAVASVRDELEPGGGSLVVEAAPPELRAAVDPWGKVSPPAFKLMQQLKLRFDHQWRLNSGRFVGGL